MRKGRKTAVKALLCAAAVFILINVCWYVWRLTKYGPCSRGMDENAFSSWIVPRYLYTDADGYDYSVKYPGYLSFTGNLCVSFPVSDNNYFTDCLIIWPKVSGDYEYGVILSEGDESYQIYIHADGSAVNPEDSAVVTRKQDDIHTLLQKAEEMWNLPVK